MAGPNTEQPQVVLSSGAINELLAVLATLQATLQSSQQATQQSAQQSTAQSIREATQTGTAVSTTESRSEDVGGGEADTVSLADANAGHLTNRKAVFDDFRTGQATIQRRIELDISRSSDHIEKLRNKQLNSLDQAQLLLNRMNNNAISHDKDVDAAVVGHHPHTPGAVVSEAEPPNAAQS